MRAGRDPTPGAPRRLRRREEEYYDPAFVRAARWLLRRGVHPNHFTFLQVPVFLLQVLAAVAHWNWAFVLLMALVVFLDAGDGILARVGNLQSKTGAVLDATFDTLGIAVVMWGATQFFPDQAAWLMLLFFGNVVLFLQNALLEEKVIAYLRGPILIAVALPPTLPGALAVTTLIVGFLVVVRAPAMFRALLQRTPLA
jgi:phosphatidylglycerophosphate synthase